jgi:1,4-dihydroxy-2-naphthoate octaprenyltransferase
MPQHAGVIPAELASVQPESLRAWLLACRPATLPAAVVPVAVGTACAHAVDAFRPGPAIAALMGALLLQIGANFANDVFDFEKGADTADRLGPTRAVQAGLLRPASVRIGIWVVFTLAVIAGAYLTAVAGFWIVAIGAFSLLAALAYTGGPYPLGYHGLGDVCVMIFFGFVAVCGTAFVQVGEVPVLAWFAALPVGALATAILVVNNLRDRATDALVGKATLAVRLGRRGALVEYVTLLSLAYLTPIVMLSAALTGALVLLPLLCLPLAAWLARRISQTEGAALNEYLGTTAKLLLLYGLLFAIGIAFGDVRA